MVEITVKVPFVDEITAHIKRHKTAYLVGTTVVITAGITYFVTRRVVSQPITVAPVFNNMPTFNNDNSSLVNFGGHTTKMVERMSDGKIWKKITEAAMEEGCSVDKMSKHVNGHSPHVYGEVYKIVGVGTTG
jgi:hypothetical protein